MLNPNPQPEEDKVPVRVVKKDKSLTYMGIILGIVIIIMGYLTLFVDDPGKIFSTDKKELKAEEPHSSLLDKTSSMSDEEVRQSLVKFIEAFYYDQRRGYFDPPSYFAPITETFYNFHNLTYQRLKELYWKRRADMENLKRNWIVSSLEFNRQDNRIIATYWASESYFRPSKREQQSADIKYELITDENGKIVSIREVEIKNFETYIINPYLDSIDSVTTAPNTSIAPAAGPIQGGPQIPATPAAPPSAIEDNKVYGITSVETVPEFVGGEKRLAQYLSTNSRYPLRTRQNANNGKVEVTFIVEKNGELKDVKLLKGIGSPYDDEALRLIRFSPNWKPGMIGGKAVRTGYQMHMTFKN